MAVAAHGSLEKRIVFSRDGMFYFKARDIGFAAINALRIIAPELRSPPFEPPRALDGIGILHVLASGPT